jgi:hypothetical protein
MRRRVSETILSFVIAIFGFYLLYVNLVDPTHISVISVIISLILLFMGIVMLFRSGRHDHTKVHLPEPKNGNNGEVSVETEPNGAIVYLDNDEKGVSPLLMQDVLKGDHEISVFLPGFFRRTTKINVDAGNRTSVRFSLAIDATAKNIDQLRKQKEDAKQKEASESAKAVQEKTNASAKMVTIQTTPTGFLRVRQDPSTTSDEVARVKPDEKYELVEETDGWYKIKLSDGKVGWVSSEFAVKDGSSQPTQKPKPTDS